MVPNQAKQFKIHNMITFVKTPGLSKHGYNFYLFLKSQDRLRSDILKILFHLVKDLLKEHLPDNHLLRCRGKALPAMPGLR